MLCAETSTAPFPRQSVRKRRLTFANLDSEFYNLKVLDIWTRLKESIYLARLIILYNTWLRYKQSLMVHLQASLAAAAAAAALVEAEERTRVKDGEIEAGTTTDGNNETYKECEKQRNKARERNTH